MALIPSLLLLFSFRAGGEVYDNKITIEGKDLPLEKVFALIEKKTHYVFFFNDETLRDTKRVTISLKDASIEDALKACLKDQPLEFRIVDKTISITRKKKQAEVFSVSLIPILTGVVLNDKNEPLAGASVSIKRSDRGTVTDQKGTFELRNVLKDAIVEFSYSGYKTKEIQLHGEDFLRQTLFIANISLDEVQVIAYGTTTKLRNTGNVTTIKSTEIEKQPVGNPLLALEGRVPGMFITQQTGLPGSGITVQIRGQNSIRNGSDPLYIVDGVPYSGVGTLPPLNIVLGSNTANSSDNPVWGANPFNYINPADIESIEILKDADATAIYGTRGANGVVLITTKKGKVGQTKIDINVQHGLGAVASKMKLLNTRQYLEMRHEAFKNDGTVPNPNADYDLTLWDTTRNTDWQKQLIGGTAQYNDAQASVSGGNNNTQFLIGSGYHRETTVFPGDFHDTKGSVHFNISNTSSSQRFRIQLSGLYSADNNLLCGYDLTSQAIQLAPNAPALYNSDGTINWATTATGVSTWPIYNPVAMTLLKYRIQTNNLVSNAILSYNLLPGLDLKSSFGYSNTQINELQTTPLIFYAPGQRPYSKRKASYADNNAHSWIIEPQLSYRRQLFGGTLSALAGATIQQNGAKGRLLKAEDFSSDLLLEDPLAAANVAIVSDAQSVYKYNAVFGRVNYNWEDRYLVNLTGRRDGSSRFGPASRFHNFGAIGAAWIFSKEDFVQKSVASVLSFGKLRGSFGTTGSDQVGDYSYMDLYMPLGSAVPYQGASGSFPTNIFTPNLSWEETRKLEAGIELGFLQDRIVVTASFYRTRSSNQLLSYNLPTITGFTTVKKNLDATVQNKGCEFELRTVNFRTKDFRWTSAFNISLNRNSLLSGAPGLSDYYQARIGYPLASNYVFRLLGVDPFTGMYQAADEHGNPTSSVSAAQASVLINFTSNYYGGFQNTISYRGFELDFLVQFKKQAQASNYLYTGRPGSFNNQFGGNQPVGVLDRWQQPGDVKPIQQFSQNLRTLNSSQLALASNQLYSDASYIRLKNLSLAWQVPADLLKNLHLQNARLYIHAQNLLTLTGYKGLDPESLSSASLPPLRVITGGIQLTL